MINNVKDIIYTFELKEGKQNFIKLNLREKLSVWIETINSFAFEKRFGDGRVVILDCAVQRDGICMEYIVFMDEEEFYPFIIKKAKNYNHEPATQ